MEAAPPHAVLEPLRLWDLPDAHSLARIRNEICSVVEEHGPSQPTPSRHLLASPHERLGLIFSELATNALRHGARPVAVNLVRTDDGWLVTVTDADAAGRPRLMAEAPQRPGGHGLRLVLRLADDVGWHREGGTKSVWAVVADEPPQHLLTSLSRVGSAS